MLSKGEPNATFRPAINNSSTTVTKTDPSVHLAVGMPQVAPGQYENINGSSCREIYRKFLL